MTVRRAVLAAALLAFTAAGGHAAGWNDIKSDHFIVSYRNAPESFAARVSERAEDDYQRTTTSLGFTRYKGWIGGSRVNIYIYDNADDYHQSAGYGWAAGSVTTANRTIASYPAAHGFFDSTLPHELGHIIFREFIGQDTVVPLWLEEGVAMHQEEGQGLGSDDDVRQALTNGKFISVADLTRAVLTKDSPRDLVEVFYAEASSLVNFLLADGEIYRFARFCHALREGSGFEGALKHSYMRYPTAAALEAAWKEHLGYETKKSY